MKLENFLELLYFAIAMMGATTWAAQVGKVQENSPAFHAGILANDEILRINDTDIKSWGEISKIIVSTEGPLKFFIRRDGEIIAKTINPYISDSQNMFNEKIKKRMIGISPSGKVITLELSISESLVYAYEKTVFASTMIFQGVQKLISGVIPSSEVGGLMAYRDWETDRKSVV